LIVNNVLYLLPQTLKHRKDHDIWRWKSTSWLETDTCMAELNQLVGPHPSLSDIRSLNWKHLKYKNSDDNNNDIRSSDIVYCNLWEGSCLIYVIYVCLRIVVSNTYCVVFFFCSPSSCVPYVASFSGLSRFDWPFGIL